MQFDVDVYVVVARYRFLFVNATVALAVHSLLYLVLCLQLCSNVFVSVIVNSRKVLPSLLRIRLCVFVCMIKEVENIKNQAHAPVYGRKKTPTFILFVHSLFARVLVRVCAFTHYINILRTLSHCVVCLLVFAGLLFTLCQFMSDPAKNWPRNKIPINVKTNVLLMYVMKCNFFFLSQHFFH